MPYHFPLGIFHAQAGYPVPERHVISRPDVFGQVRAVGTQCLREFLEGKSRTDIAVGTDPFFDFPRYFGMVGRQLLLPDFFRLRVAQDFFFRSDLAFHCPFYLFIKQQIVQVTMEKVDVEWDGG